MRLKNENVSKFKKRNESKKKETKRTSKDFTIPIRLFLTPEFVTKYIASMEKCNKIIVIGAHKFSIQRFYHVNRLKLSTIKHITLRTPLSNL